MMGSVPSAALLCGEKLEPLARGVSVIVGGGHTFSTDTVLLASFSMPKKGEVCADFGTGCGTVPLLWCARSQPSFIYAVEIQPRACGMAERSVALNGFQDRIGVIRCDLRELADRKAVPYGLDLIACNPPYQPAGAGVQSASEAERIARHEVACGFPDIAAAASAFLRWGGRFCCCMRPERLCDTLSALRREGLEPNRLRFVQQRRESAPFLFLLQAGRGGRPGLSVGPVLLIEKEGGGLSEEMTAIYGDYKEGGK